MGKAIHFLFNLYPGEARKAGLFILLALLWGIGSYGTLILSEGMFLEHVGSESLPLTYLLIAISLCIFSSILIFALNRVSIPYLLFTIITVWVITNFAFYFLMNFTAAKESFAFWVAFKVVGWMIPISTYICYWSFIDQYFDLQDGKRFFSLFNSILFLGDAIAGGIISFAIESFGVERLLFFFTVTMAFSLPFIFLITKRIAPVLEEHVESINSTSSIQLKPFLKKILHSKFTLFLLLFYFAMQLVAIVTEFSYMESVERNFTQSSTHALTEFIGTCGMWISIGNMIFGGLLYSRLVKKIGVNNMIIIAPAFFFAIFCAWTWHDALSIAIFGIVAREGMVYAFDDNNLNLLITGVPSKIKNQVRIFVESFFEPIGMLTSAILLIFFSEKSHGLGLILSLAALGVVLFLRSHYPKAIFQNLVASAIRFEKKATDWIPKKERKGAEFLLLSHLKRPNETSQLLAFEYLIKLGNIRILPRLLNHIGKLSLPGKLKAIELLRESSWAKENTVLERMERWRRILPHPAIKSSIHFYFASHRLLRPEHMIHDLQSDHLGLRTAAILTFKTNHHASQLPSYCSLASEKLRLLLDSKLENEICAGIHILGFENILGNFQSLYHYLQHPSLNVNRAAAKAMSCLAHPDWKSFALTLIDKLPSIRDPEVRMSCLEVLLKFSDLESLRNLILSTIHFRPNERKLVEKIILNIGKEGIPLLIDLTHEKSIHERCRLLAGKTLAKLDRQALRRNILSIIHPEIERAYLYFYHAHTIQQLTPEYDLSILVDALITGYHSVIDFMIQLIGAAGAIDECDILSYSLKSKNRKIRAQALETLEKTCDSRLFNLLLPLIGEMQPEERAKYYLKGGRSPLSLDQLLDVMAQSPSLADQIVSISLKARLKTPDWKTILYQKLESNEEIFHHFAHELLKS